MKTKLDPKTLRWVARRLALQKFRLPFTDYAKGYNHALDDAHGVTLAKARAIESAAKRKGAKR